MLTCTLRKFFNEKALHEHASLVSGESTPSDLFDADLIVPRLKAVCPWAQLLVILRNPVDRAFSQYQM